MQRSTSSFVQSLRFGVPLARGVAVALFVLVLAGCTTVVELATGGMAENLNDAILNQDDPELVRDGAPAYLLMLDSFIEGDPESLTALGAGAQLYAAYGVIFVDDPERAKRLTARARSYGERAICVSNEAGCDLSSLHPADFEERLEEFDDSDVPALYAYGVGWLAYIQAHSDESLALAYLPQATAVMERVRDLDAAYQATEVDHYLAVLNTIRPPALGGDFETGRLYYERAIARSDGKDLSVKVDYARYYARTLYDRELHDRLLGEVLEADPHYDGYTLFNTLAQRQAEVLLASADDYF